MDLDVRTTDEARLRRLDGLVLLWLVLWVVIGGWTAVTVWQLSELGDTVSSSGTAISSTGEALGSLGGVPVVGERTAELGDEVVVAGQDIADRGQEVESQLRQLSVLLGLVIVLLLTMPVLWLYLPQRSARRRDFAEVRQLLHGSTDEVVRDRYLAAPAVAPRDAAAHRGGSLAGDDRRADRIVRRRRAPPVGARRATGLSH